MKIKAVRFCTDAACMTSDEAVRITSEETHVLMVLPPVNTLCGNTYFPIEQGTEFEAVSLDEITCSTCRDRLRVLKESLVDDGVKLRA